MHRGIDAARVRVDAGVAEVALVVDLDVVGRVERIDRSPRSSEERVALRAGFVGVSAPFLRRVETRAVLGRGHQLRILRCPVASSLDRPSPSGGGAKADPKGCSVRPSSPFQPDCGLTPRPAPMRSTGSLSARAQRPMTPTPPLRPTEVGSARSSRLPFCEAPPQARRRGTRRGGSRVPRRCPPPASGGSTRRPELPRGGPRPREGRGSPRAHADDGDRRSHPRRGLHRLPSGRVALGRLRGCRWHRGSSATLLRGHPRDGVRSRDDRRRRGQDRGVPTVVGAGRAVERWRWKVAIDSTLAWAVAGCLPRPDRAPRHEHRHRSRPHPRRQREGRHARRPRVGPRARRQRVGG